MLMFCFNVGTGLTIGVAVGVIFLLILMVAILSVSMIIIWKTKKHEYYDMVSWNYIEVAINIAK